MDVRKSSRKFLVVPLMALFVSLVSATSHYAYSSQYTAWLNQYFLPANAPVSGLSGLIFGVLLPFALVTILIYYGLSNVFTDNERVAKSLAIIISLFIIPSGGYKGVSELLISVFGVGNTGLNPVIPGAGPFSGSTFAAVLGVLTFLVLGVVFQKEAEGSINVTQIMVSVLAGVFVWLLLDGQITFMGFLGAVVLAAMGWYIFQIGFGTGSLQGALVGIIGLLIALWAIKSTGLLPEQLESLITTVSTLTILVLIVLLVLIGVGIYYVINYR